MAKKNSDTGAATNLNNFGTMITRLRGLGPKYDPGNDDLKLVNLQAVLDDGLVIASDYAAKEAIYSPAIAAKQQIFETGGKLLSPIVAALKTGKASIVTIETVKGYVDKYRGVVKKAKKEDDAAMNGDDTASTDSTKGERSNRQTSYAFLVQHFERIYQTLLAEPKYAPKNNDAIKTPALKTVLDSMRANVTAADGAQDAFSTVRYQQTVRHNDPDTGICALAAMVKANLVEDYGVSSSEYKSVSYLPFKKLYDSTAKKKRKKAAEDAGDEGAKQE